MNFKGIIFLLFILGTYFGMHVFFYFSTLHFFSITEQKTKWLLGVIFLTLSISFIVSMILTRLSGFVLIKYIYILTACWLGLVATFFLAFILAWIFIFIFKAYNIKIVIGTLAILLPFLYGIYGLSNAFNPSLKNVEVSILDLPSYWESKKIVQLSDLHLGRVNNLPFAEEIVAKVNSVKPDLVLITGDLFDGMGSNIPEFINTLNKLESTHGTYFVTGNHEIYLGLDYVFENLVDNKINVLDNEVININGLQLVGLSYPNFNELRDKNFLENIPNYNKSLPSILMHHAPTNIIQNNVNNQHSSIYWSPDVNFDIAKANGINLQLSGHTHKGQIFPYNLIVDYIYKGYGYGLVTEGDFNIYTTSGVGTWGPPMRVGSKSEIPLITLRRK